MKKLIAISLCLAMVLGLIACGKTENQEETSQTYSESIPIGDGVDDIDITGACFGTYQIIDIEQEDYLDECETVVTYYSADSDTPYIEVFTSPKKDMSLEEYTKESAEKNGNGYYQMLDGFGYYTCPWEDEDGFFYCSVLTYEGTENFHMVCFSAKTEEMHLGGNLYMWAPTGYTVEDYEWENKIFAASYEESYAFPEVIITLDDNTYEDIVNYYSFNGDVNITEEQYNEWSENWTEETTEAFYEAVGFKVLKTLVVDSEVGELYGYILDNQRIATPYSAIAYIPFGDHNYRINLWCEGDTPAYPYLYAAMKSVHTGEEASNADTRTDFDVEISENLPTIHLNGTYTSYDVSEYGICAYKGGEGADYYAFEVYAWESSDLTLLEEAQEDIDTYYPESDIYPVEMDTWENQGDYSYSYYIAYDNIWFDAPVYTQAYFFIDGDTTYVIYYYSAAKEVIIREETGLTMMLSENYKDSPLTEEEKAAGAISCYVDESGYYEGMNFSLYKLSSSIEDMQKTADFIEAEPYTYTDIDGVTRDCLYAEFIDSDSYGEYYNVCYYVPYDGYTLAFDFWASTDTEVSAYRIAAAEAGMSSLNR